jgi:hypothetical protein
MTRRLVAEKLTVCEDQSKIVAYSRQNIRRVDQLGERLECSIYYRNVDSRQGKEGTAGRGTYIGVLPRRESSDLRE